MFKGGTNSGALTKPHGINVSQAVYGNTVPLSYGLCQNKGYLVWYNDWQSSGSPTNSNLAAVVGASSGGKKSGKASKKGNIKYYSAALDILLTHSPAAGVLSAWYNTQKFAVVPLGASGFVSGGQFTFSPAAGNTTTTITGTVPGSPYQVTASNFVSDLNQVKAGGISLQPAAYPPGAGQYSVSPTGIYTFNVAQSGASYSISYRRTGTSSGAILAGVIGVTVSEQYNVSFNDFGGPGTVTQSGTWERPLWNSRYPVPGRLDAGAYTARDPYSFWWDGSNPTVHFPAELEGKPVTVYYGVPAIYKSDGTFFSSTLTPLELLNLEFEPAFASGSEYTNHPSQKIVQNWVCGLGSVRFDLSVANAMPNMNFETLGAFTLWPNGDADVCDIISDIAHSGPILVGPNVTQPSWAAAGPPAPGSGTGTITGLVRDSVTGAPISGASVTWASGSATTSSTGSFSLTSVTAGSVSVTVSKTGYTSFVTNITVYTSSTTTLNVQLDASSGTSAGPWVEVDNIQALSGWIQPSNAGNTGGKSASAHGTYSITGPNGDGSYTFAIAPASSYDNYYFYHAISGQPTTAPRKFLYHMEFMYPTGNLAKSQGFEFELQYSDGAYTYNMAWAAYSGGWNYFHYIGKPGGNWINSGIPTNLADNTKYIVDAEFLLDPVAGTTTHNTLTINGVVHNVGITQAAILKHQSNYLNAAVQLDSKRVYQPYGVQVKANVLWLP